ncbi:hypothetical protein CSC35_0067 [Enterobacter hormaechei]|nr:hypothetical protein CSC35_0067 [Enterobacter hormaechei]
MLLISQLTMFFWLILLHFHSLSFYFGECDFEEVIMQNFL